MLKITDPTQCCGCTACASICSHHAISMQPDALGFLYPVIDYDKCIDCGLCEKVCAFNENYDKRYNLPQPLALAARHKSLREIETSRSGAVFIALSDWVLEQGGVVYGVGFDSHFRVVHKRATSKIQRDEFKGSKYVQSDLRTIFLMIKKDLKDGLVVLFSGTACQTAGLNSYVEKRFRDKLFLVDIICHGVPGPKIWEDYIAFLEKKHHDKIVEVNFRDKQMFGWDSHKETFVFSKNPQKVTTPIFFYKTLFFRKSCNVCHFTNLNRPSDITLGDFWGWEKVDENLNKDNKGISLVFVNSKKGEEWFSKIKDEINFMSVPIDCCLQPNLQHPSAINPDRMSFEEDYVKYGFLYVMRKYGELNRIYQIRCFLSRIKQTFRKFLGV